MKINLHSHTARCGHASGTEKEYIEEALRVGMTDFGFSDHTPMPFPEGYSSAGMRMGLDQMDDYTDTILALKKEYKDKINIYLGLEVEYYPELFDKLMVFLEDYPVEYMILGQHCTKNQYDGRWAGEETEDEERLVMYADQVIEGLGTGKFIYLAHPDLINFAGDERIYLKEMSRICEYAYDHHVPLEINLLGIGDGRNYPNPLFWKLAGETGNDVVIGLDAHHVHMIDVPQTEKMAMEIVSKYNLNLIPTPLPEMK
ncbi:MAG: histidinol-phosphatase [Lachnospiraceae bacterium]|nr:histidinol-phosphatase [Lachnospiraceae bacterium]